MSKFVDSLMAGVQARPASDLEADPIAAFAHATKEAHRVGKTPVEQEFPGLVSIGVLPHFMMPGVAFYHEPTGLIVYGSLTCLPGLTPFGSEWLAIPMVVRYTATQRFTQELAIQAIKATYLQSVVLPGPIGEMQQIRIVMADAVNADEVAPGIFETYALLALHTGKDATDKAVESFNAILNKIKDQ